MSARHKLNVAYFNGCILIALVIGALAGSGVAFLLALAVLVACGVYAGEIRPGPRKR